MRIATVFGGSGFIGRAIVRRLANAGWRVRVAVRDPERALFLKTMGDPGQVQPMAASVNDPASVARAVAGASAVINLVGILAERRAGDFMRAHAEGAGNVARAAAEAGVSALVQMSSLGVAADHPSLYARSKAAGEEAVRAAFPGAAILRPSLVFGPGDGFFNRFGAMARVAPALPVIGGGSRFQPVYVQDVAAAAVAALAPAAAGRTFELGGPDVATMRELLASILAWTGRRRCLVEVPMPIARLQASVLERLPGRMLTRDQLLLLARDNVVTPGAAGLEALGIVPTPMRSVLPAQLAWLRPANRRSSDLI